MELKWLEDFFAFVRFGSFSRAADSRNVTQSGFSRRIRSLEEWMGAELVDRSKYPAALTSAGKLLAESAPEIIENLYSLRATIRDQHRMPGNSLRIAAGHTLSSNFLPPWLTGLTARFGQDVCARIVASNVHDSVQSLVHGGCDLLLCYHHSQLPVLLDPQRYRWLLVGRDTLVPVSAPGARGKPKFVFKGTAPASIPLLAYTDTAYLGAALQLLLQTVSADRVQTLRRTYESDMADVLKGAAVASQGLAWLPRTSIAAELERGTLVIAGDESMTMEFELRLYRDIYNESDLVSRLWGFLADTIAGSD
jgi:DNA-binding transcriptional LysR family regulator